jgi:hypothetical protein
MLIASEPMTVEKSPGIFVFLLKNTNKMELDKSIMEKIDSSKIGYMLNKDYLMTKREDLKKAIKELKGWHLI